MPADRPIRRGQLISPFGVGAMISFPRDESLMTAGLDAWTDHARKKCPPDWLVREERLEARLGVTHLRLPPEHRDPGTGVTYANEDIPFVRFPRWHYCHFCGGMEELPLFANNRQRCRAFPWPTRNCVQRARKPWLIPVRFITACPQGHIQDFPFMEWVHRGQASTDNCRLRLMAGRSSAGLTGIKISCTCGQIRSLGGIFDFNEERGGALHRIGCDCRGLRPWFGEWENHPGCGEFLQVVQRGASNVYFPHVVSSIYLPLWAEATASGIVKALEDPRVWGPLSSGLVDSKISADRCEMVGSMRNLDAEELRKAAQRKLEGIPEPAILATQTEEAFRRSEYDALKAGRGAPQSDLLVEPASVQEYAAPILSSFSYLALIHKLRETRALAGFTRLLPPDGNLASPRLQRLALDQRIDWLPAMIVRGEGLFIEFDRARLDAWLNRTQAIRDRIANLNGTYNVRRVAQGQNPRPVTPEFVLLHTFAHVLINQLAYDCGYGSASLRERLYCSDDNPDEPMCGVLIYTASGDSEGSMGGLVRQGERGTFENIVARAIQKAAWCSSDPVCIESQGQGADNCNLSACHSCCLVPETSCEEGNRLLDRALLVGKPGEPDIGFFIVTP
ncbi:MAG: hypothetical protein JWQ87_5565 [Candidatus Sulfotelmatobacter sp.]|nr:hypothetical protein [Candidatus Sulfotelmatobacter sp.]